MIATTIEQSKRLLELGLSPDSADMEYCYIDEFNNGLQIKSDTNAEVDKKLDVMFGVTHIPAWSLSALLEVMPKMEADSTVCLGCVSTLIRCKSHDFMWQHDSIAVQPIDAAYQMVCWLLEQDFIKKGDNDE